MITANFFPKVVWQILQFPRVLPSPGSGWGNNIGLVLWVLFTMLIGAGNFYFYYISQNFFSSNNYSWSKKISFVLTDVTISLQNILVFPALAYAVNSQKHIIGDLTKQVPRYNLYFFTVVSTGLITIGCSIYTYFPEPLFSPKDSVCINECIFGGLQCKLKSLKS